jgi:MFS family permease
MQYRDFRRMWWGSFLSNVGSWMQNVVLPAYIYNRTEQAWIVGLFMVAQLGPLLVLSIPGGVIADRYDRRRWLAGAQGMQLAFSLGLALCAALDSTITLLFIMQLGVGVGNALNAPAFGATLPSLVPPEDLPGAVSLNSVIIQGSRVVGPILVAILLGFGLEPWHVFLFNALTYVFVIVAILSVTIPHHNPPPEEGWRSLTLGFRFAKERPVIGRVLLSMTTFSFICLAHVGLFPAVAELNYGIDAESSTYQWLYSIWGLGAMFGALSVSTVFSRIDKRSSARNGFVAFGVALLAFNFASGHVMVFTTGFILGFFYFVTTTSLFTVLQARLDHAIRARVIALWYMAFGGVVPISSIVFGPVVDAVGPRLVLVAGSAWAFVLFRWCDIARMEKKLQVS